jgi:diguanylate cyclase (GGDEF)-like protein
MPARTQRFTTAGMYQLRHHEPDVVGSREVNSNADALPGPARSYHRPVIEVSPKSFICHTIGVRGRRTPFVHPQAMADFLNTDGFIADDAPPLGDHERAMIAELGTNMRAAGWDIAMTCVELAIDRATLPSLAALGTVKRLSNLPAFIGALGAVLARPQFGRRFGTNPVLVRLARDHVIERERAGFTAREIVSEFLLLRRVLWRFVQEHIPSSFDTRTLLHLEDRINSILDEVIAECTVIYVERSTQELSERSRRDSMTGLLNHQAFHTRVDEELDRAARYGHELQIIYFDLDDFKQVNDTLGHPEGDRVLRVISEMIRESIRESDVAGRIGGDEFVLCLVESNELAAHLLLDRLRERLAQHISSGVVPACVGISAGCASFPHDAADAPALIALADRRQYEDKRARKVR